MTVKECKNCKALNEKFNKWIVELVKDLKKGLGENNPIVGFVRLTLENKRLQEKLDKFEEGMFIEDKK